MASPVEERHLGNSLKGVEGSYDDLLVSIREAVGNGNSLKGVEGHECLNQLFPRYCCREYETP